MCYNNYAGKTRFISRSIHTTFHRLIPTVMEIMAVKMMMTLTNQCAPMELTATGKTVYRIICKNEAIFTEIGVTQFSLVAINSNNMTNTQSIVI